MNGLTRFLLIFNMIVFTSSPVVLLSNNTHAFLYPEVHEKTLYEITNQSSSKQIAHIPIGNAPETIGVNTDTNTIYVANYLDNTVSVINGENNTKIGDDIMVGKGPREIVVNPSSNLIYVAYQDNNFVSVINGTNYNNTKIRDDIPVGKGPNAIGVNWDTNTMYVANYGSNSISIISLTNNTKIGHDIPVGKGPEDIDVNWATNTIYVAHDDDSISVIDGINNTQIGSRILVGKGPNAIGVNWDTNTIYVANNWDNAINVIDGKANKVLAQVTFNTEPFNGGRIECDKDKLTAPLGQQFYVYSGTLCTAKPNQGFEFVSWQENLGGNSTQLLKFSSTSNIVDSILDFFNMKPDKKEAALNITKFGSFTANFNPLPPPIPPQYVATLVTVVITAFIGTWLTPTIIQWRNRRKQGSKLDHYHNEVKKLYNDGELNSNNLEQLNKLGYHVTEEYIRGKINKEQYDKLGNELSVSYSEIFIKEIDSLSTLSKNEKVEQLSRVKSNIENAYLKGRLNELHHTLLKNRLAHYEKIE